MKLFKMRLTQQKQRLCTRDSLNSSNLKNGALKFLHEQQTSHSTSRYLLKLNEDPLNAEKSCIWKKKWWDPRKRHLNVSDELPFQGTASLQFNTQSDDMSSKILTGWSRKQLPQGIECTVGRLAHSSWQFAARKQLSQGMERTVGRLADSKIRWKICGKSHPRRWRGRRLKMRPSARLLEKGETANQFVA
jgi:hypothetical protein